MTSSITLQPTLGYGSLVTHGKDWGTDKQTVLFATSEPAVREGTSALLASRDIEVIWVQSMAEAKAVLSRVRVAAFFCGFWLVDATYRDVISYLKHQRSDLPLVIVSCPQEHKNYLASLKIRALEFLTHPYRAEELDRILDSAWQTAQNAPEAKEPVDAEHSHLQVGPFATAHLSPAT